MANAPTKRGIHQNEIIMNKDKHVLPNLPLIRGNKWRRLVLLKGQK